MKLFALRLTDSIGSFGPIELLEATINDIKQLYDDELVDKLTDEKKEEIAEVKAKLENAEIVVGDLCNLEFKSLKEYFNDQHQHA